MDLGLISRAVRLASKLPKEYLDCLAAKLADGGPSPHVSDLMAAISNPDYRADAKKFLDYWMNQAPAATCQAVALVLAAAGESREQQRKEQQIEVVWTGKASPYIPVRPTEQVLLELIREAKASLTLVSFGLNEIPQVAVALRTAAEAGVAVRLILGETETQLQHADFRNKVTLGKELVAKCRIYYWPLEKRPVHHSGLTGVMHAKCAIADRRTLFLTSANLTGTALSVNMEMGFVIRGGGQAETVERHFDHLSFSGDLQEFRDSASGG
jgi:phosphatidylserine/phosphatidylglycerophosphate/cardiolipin synthase-like enzyme